MLITSAFQLFFRIHHRESPRKQRGVRNEWETSAGDVNLSGETVNIRNKKTEPLLEKLVEK
jgi:hypothetical protein